MQQQVFGRDAELAALAEFLAARQHSAGVLVLGGPPGSGKTTLLRAGAAIAAEHGVVVLHTAPARSDLRLAFAGLTDLLERRLGDVAHALPPPQARALRVALLEEEPAARPPEPRLIAVAFRSALAMLAAAVPVLLIVDDVQWLDEPSERAIGFALRRLQDEPVGLLCAQRTERPGAGPPLELDRARCSAEVLPVGPLSIGALHRLLRIRLGASFSQPTLRKIESQSGGNPFIALELGRALARRGATSVAGADTSSSAGALSVAAAVLPVPATLSGLVAERLGELPPPVVDAVRLVALMPDAPVGQYLAAGAGGIELDAAVEAGVLEQNDGRLRFSHPLLASAVAGAIPPAQLRALHASAARLAVLPEERVRHLAFAAAEPTAALAAELDAAASAAMSRGAPSAAAELLGLAASLTPEDDPHQTARRRLEMAQQLETAGETGAARATLEKLIETEPSGPLRAAALSQLASLRDDDLPAASRLLHQALADAGGDPALSAEIHLRMSVNSMIGADIDDSLDQARQSVAAAEPCGQPALLASCLAQVFQAACQHGTQDEGDLRRAAEIERAGGFSPLGLSPAMVAGIYYFQQGRLDEAEAAQRQCLVRAEADGIEELRQGALLRLSRIAGRRGDAKAAAELAAEGLEIAEQLDLARPLVAQLYASASAALLLGQAEKVRQLAGRGRELAQHTGDRPYVICHEALLGSLDLALGDVQAAVSRLGPLARTLPEIGWHPTTQSIFPDVAEALAASGEVDDAARLLAVVERAMPDPLTAALIARCRGVLASARGDLQGALADLDESVRRLDLLCPHPLERGRTLLTRGSVLRRLNQRAAARATLLDALGMFERTSAPLWAAQARAELARISGRPPEPDQLTATELRVAELVASGRSNKEAAAELFVTVRTIESTLTRTYAKLGVRSRTELAARLRSP